MATLQNLARTGADWRAILTHRDAIRAAHAAAALARGAHQPGALHLLRAVLHFFA